MQKRKMSKLAKTVLTAMVLSTIISSGVSATNNVMYDNDEHTSITLNGTSDKGIGATLKNVLDGDVSKGSKDAVNGNQLFERDQRMDDLYQNYIKNHTLIENLSTQINNHKTTLLDYESKIDNLEAGYNININGFQRTALNKDNTTLSFNDSDSIKVKYNKETGLKFEADTGKVEAGSTKLVTAGDVYNAISNMPTDTTLTNKMDADLGNINTVGRKNFANMANEAVKLTQGNNSIITKVLDENGNANYIIDISDGEITEDSDKLVTGKTVYDYMKKNGASVDTSNLATIDGANITVASWQKALGTGKNEENNTGLITGDTLYKAIQKNTYTGSDTISVSENNQISVVANGKVEAGNNGLVTGAQVNEAISKATENIPTSSNLENKVNKDLSNITDEGKNVIKDTVKDELSTKADVSYVDNKVKDLNNKLDTKADKTYVDEQLKNKVSKDELNASMEGKADKTYVDEQLKDKVSKDELNASIENKADKSYVNETVDNAVKDKVTTTELETKLADKANTDGSNLTEDNVKSWTEKLGTGTVAKNNNNLVTGNEVYKAISQVDPNKGLLTSDENNIYVGKNDTTNTVDFKNSKGEDRVLTGIKTDETDETSAVNVGYVNKNVESIYNNMNYAMDNMYSKLNKDMNKGIAGASALAALKPLDYDPGDKISFAVGYGHYRSSNATAIGLFYRPNENTMINIGTSLGNGNNAVNAGLSFKLGKGSPYNGLSKAEMASALVEQGDELVAQRKEIQNLKKDNEELRKKLEEILEKMK